ncbi:ABC transporter permease subunit [Alkalibaculum sp. M08DMB]|uniref:ABC transporter permease subunit n=2 Tax=Alkalibaculum sporogenes TaxID=2655001 RepID=A0A6A7K6A0_9FIRM|nr:ABC transporter permease subunit [Alkalibaculum sporogenes]
MYMSEKNFSKEHEQYIKKLKTNRFNVIATRTILLVFFIIFWEVAAELQWIDSFITSQPTRVLKTLVNLFTEGTLFKHLFTTVLETIIGFTTSTILGTVIAIILWWSPFISKVADPYLVVLNSLPKVALGPIILVWVGAGPVAIIVMAVLISLVVTISGVYSGFTDVDEAKITLVKTFGATKLQILTKVVLPASYPTITNALKINVGLSWVGVIMGEFLVSKAGLGYLIVYGSQVFQLDLVMTSILILSLAAGVMYQIIAYIEKKLIPYK